MKKMNYPKVMFYPCISENNQWEIIPYVTISDVYNFDKKVYKQMLKDNILCYPKKNGNIEVEFIEFVKTVKKLHKVSDKFLEFTRYINDYKLDANKRAELFIFAICKSIKEKGHDIRKDIIMFNEELNNNDNDIVSRQVTDYVEYLADRCIIQDESLIDMYSMAYEYIISKKLLWLTPALNYMDYDY